MVRVDLLVCGSTHQRGRLAGTIPGRIEFPSLVAVLHHPEHGAILFDTGHSPQMSKLLTTIPEKIWLKVFPSKLADERSAARQLAARGISPNSVTRIIVSHYHADHIGGLTDFRNARFMQGRQLPPRPAPHATISQAKAGFFPQLLPEDYPTRVDWVANLARGNNEALGDFGEIFPRSYDLLGDSSILLVDLPGHERGQIGCYLPRTTRPNGRDGPPLFLTADSSWTIDAIKSGSLPPAPVLALFDSADDYRHSINRIARLASRSPETLIVPSHSSPAIATARSKLG